jgi:CubicO group peptidase (beta-lactamase class C family)
MANRRDLDISAMAGTGDIWSTVEDLTHYSYALHTGALLRHQSRQAMTTAYAAVDNPGAANDRRIIGRSYGHGLFIGTIAGRQAYFHPGDVPGYVSLAAWLPEDRISIAILSNDDTSKPEDLIKDLMPIADIEPHR